MKISEVLILLNAFILLVNAFVGVVSVVALLKTRKLNKEYEDLIKKAK